MAGVWRVVVVYELLWSYQDSSIDDDNHHHLNFVHLHSGPSHSECVPCSQNEAPPSIFEMVVSFLSRYLYCVMCYAPQR
jgi:hypothetical protein